MAHSPSKLRLRPFGITQGNSTLPGRNSEELATMAVRKGRARRHLCQRAVTGPAVAGMEHVKRLKWARDYGVGNGVVTVFQPLIITAGGCTSEVVDELFRRCLALFKDTRDKIKFRKFARTSLSVILLRFSTYMARKASYVGVPNPEEVESAALSQLSLGVDFV